MSRISRLLKEAHGTEGSTVDAATAAPRFAAAAGSNAPEAVHFDEVYRGAGVQDPAHGFTVFRLLDTESDEGLRSVDPKTLAQVITGILRHLPGGPVPLEDIFRDAASRDRALDAYDKYLTDLVQDRVQKTAAESRALQEEIDRLFEKNRALIAENDRRIEAEQDRLAVWRGRRAEEERRVTRALAPFVPGLADEPSAPQASPPPPHASLPPAAPPAPRSFAPPPLPPPLDANHDEEEEMEPESPESQTAAEHRSGATRTDRPPADRLAPFSSPSTGLRRKKPPPPPKG